IAGTYSTNTQNQYRRASVGFLGGLQWGYNWQVGGLLVGLEGDWNWSNEKDTLTYATQPPITFVGSNGPYPVFPNTTQGWTSAARSHGLTRCRRRLGGAGDCFLWYVTAGVAWAKIENNYILASTPGQTGTGADFTAVGTIWGLPGGSAAANFSTTKTG